MTIIRQLSWTLVVTLIAAHHASAQSNIEVGEYGFGSGDISDLSVTGDETAGYNVSFTATLDDGWDSYGVRVRKATSGTGAVNQVTVKALKGDTDGYILVTIEPKTYPTHKLGILKGVSKHASSTADLTIAVTNVGQIGTSGSPGTISANAFGTIRAVKMRAFPTTPAICTPPLT